MKTSILIALFLTRFLFAEDPTIVDDSEHLTSLPIGSTFTITKDIQILPNVNRHYFNQGVKAWCGIDVIPTKKGYVIEANARDIELKKVKSGGTFDSEAYSNYTTLETDSKLIPTVVCYSMDASKLTIGSVKSLLEGKATLKAAVLQKEKPTP